MANFAKALKSVINGSNNFCCLCFNICDAKDLLCSKDEASFVRNNTNESIVISDLILTILGSEFTQYLETLEYICELCTKSLISSYTFIQTCNSNATLLSNALESLNKGVQDVTKPDENTLFVSISLDNFSTRLIYDHGNILNPTTALKRYQLLNTPRIKEKPKTKDKNNKYSAKDLKMLFEPSNLHIFQCKICLKIYSSMSHLRNHYMRVHEKKLNKQPKTTQKKDYLRVDESIFTCKECGKNFKHLSSLKVHQMNEMIIVCPDCGRTYKNKSTFKNHLQLNICKQERRHSPSEAKYTCDYCNKKYTQKVSLRVHIQFEHGNYKAHICEWCGKKFWAQSRLKAHIVKHTRERNFTCPICQRKFVTKESLLYHTRLHTGEKPYNCPECSSSFLSASRRSDHVKRYHDSAKPGVECDICHSKFKCAEVLSKHKRTHDEQVMILNAKPPKRHNTSIIQHFKVKNKNRYVKRNIYTETEQKNDFVDTVDKYFVKDIVYLD